MYFIAKEAQSVEAGQASSTFRVLARRPLSLDVDGGAVQEIEIQGVDCLIAVEALQSDEAKRKELGGSRSRSNFCRTRILTCSTLRAPD
jgi:hypothetical protein